MSIKKLYLSLAIAALLGSLVQGLKTGEVGREKNVERREKTLERRDRGFVFDRSSSKGKGRKKAPKCKDLYRDGTLKPPIDEVDKYRALRLSSYTSTGGGGGRGKGKGSKYCVPSTIECGQHVTDYSRLERSLSCELQDDQAAVTVVGPGTVLDCDGNMIFSRNDPAAKSVGVRLVNGATLKNCFVKGFEIGVEMVDGDNTVEDSTIFRNNDAIKTRGEGCMTVEDSIVTNSLDDAILVMNTGAFILKETQVLDSNSDGVLVKIPNEEKVLVFLEDINVFSTVGHQAFQIDKGGQVDVEFYGKNRIVDAEDEGFKERSSDKNPATRDVPSHSTIYGDLIIEHSGENGLGLRDGSVFVVREEATLEVCNSNSDSALTNDVGVVSRYVDINTGKTANVTVVEGTIICDTLDRTAQKNHILSCSYGCSSKNEALACIDYPEY